MSHRKVHSQGSVPFSWENQPGICKVTYQECPADVGRYGVNLPPPPCPSESPRVFSGHHDLQIPLPPCPFQPPSRSSSRRGLRKQDDPFLAAYKEVTKSVEQGKLCKNIKKGCGSRVGRSGFLFSCKHSRDVKEDSLVRLSRLPLVPKESLEAK